MQDTDQMVVHVRGKGIGKHGYDPKEPDMTGIFFATGPSFPPKSHPVSMKMTDVAPLIAKALKVEFQPLIHH